MFARPRKPMIEPELHRVHDTLGGDQIRAVALPRNDVARHFHQVARLVRRFGEEAFEQLLVDVVRHLQRNVVGTGQHRRCCPCR
jgi:hypothetical protein